MSQSFTTEFSDTVVDSIGGGGSRGGEVQFDVKRLIVLRAPLMIAIGLLVGPPLALAAWFLVPVKFSATADIQFSREQQQITQDGTGVARWDEYETWVQTQKAIMGGMTVLSRVLDQPDIESLPEVVGQQDPVAFLQGTISTESARRSELVTVRCSMQDRDAARLILEQVVKQYMEMALSEESLSGSQRLRILYENRDALERELDLLNRQIGDKMARIGAMSTDGGLDATTEADLYRQNLVRAEEDVSLAEAQVADLEETIARLDAMREGGLAQPAFEFGVEDRVNADPAVGALRQELARLDAEYNALATRARPGSSPLNAAQRRRDSMRATLATEERSARREAVAAVRSTAEEQLADARVVLTQATDRVEKFDAQLESQQSNMQAAATAMAELEQLQNQATDKERLLTNIRAQITEVAIESNAPARVKQASQIFVPSEPDFGRRYAAVLAALAMGGMLGLSVGIARELTDQQLRSPSDIARISRRPVIAAIPHAQDDKRLRDVRLETLAATNPNTMLSHEVRRIIGKTLYPEDHSAEANTILIASPSLGDGKTTLACNLAISLAQANRRVLLVDLSALRPVIEEMLDADRGPGLAEILHGAADVETAVRESKYENLFVLGPGLEGYDLAGRLASRDMIRFVEYAENNFDHVVIDSPPTLLMSDAKLLAPIVDAVVVIVGAGVSTRGMVGRCLRELEVTGANLVGVVMNAVRGQRFGYMRSNQELFYDYGDGPLADQATEPATSSLPEIELLDAEHEADDIETVELVELESKRV